MYILKRHKADKKTLHTVFSEKHWVQIGHTVKIAVFKSVGRKLFILGRSKSNVVNLVQFIARRFPLVAITSLAAAN